jgi:chaperone required for assembly of F1-ATPase
MSDLKFKQNSQKPKRFWTKADIETTGGGYLLKLDGLTAKTPAKRDLQTRHESVAYAMAEEWNAVGEELDVFAMPLTRLLNVALDSVEDTRDEVVGATLAYLGSDLLCYRAESPEKLISQQSEMWDPVLQWAEQAHGIRLVTAGGIIFAEQPEQTLEKGRALLSNIAGDVEVLTAFHIATSLCGSFLLSLALHDTFLNAEEAWKAAHIDEDWNANLWGEDREALMARKARQRDFDAAAFVLRSVRN